MSSENFDLEVIDLDEDDKAPLIPSGVGTGNGSVQADAIARSNKAAGSSIDLGCCSQMDCHGFRNLCSLGCCAHRALRCFPFVRIVMAYNWRKNILPDLIAGLTVGIMNIPQGMAYAMLADLDPVVGLYVSFFAPLLYFVFGTSRQLSLGTFALISLMLANPVTRLAGDSVDPELFEGLNLTQEVERNRTTHEVLADLRWEVALAVSMLAGLMQIGMGILQLGFLAVFLSDALVSGFTTGAAIHVFTSQLPAVFGVKIPRHSGAWKLIKIYRELVLAARHTNLVTLAVSGVSLSVLIVVRIYVNPLVMQKIKFPIPVELLLVIIGTVVSYTLQLHANWSVQVVGKIPSGFPPPRVPKFHLMPHVALDAVTIAIFAFACSISLAKIFSRKHKYELDANQEAFTLGLTNTIIPFFGAFCASASLSRSMVQDEMGGKSQFAGLISSSLILVVLLSIGPLFSSAPNCILSCIVLISLKGLFKQFAELPKLWKTSKYDFAIWVASFLCTLLLDVALGLLAGLAFSLLTVVARAHKFSATTVTAVPNEMETSLKPLPGTRLVRFEGPLYFGSAERLRQEALLLSGVVPSHRSSPLRLPMSDATLSPSLRPSATAEVTRRLIIDCSRLTFVDSTGVRFLQELAEDLEPLGVELTLVDGEKQLLTRLCSERTENMSLTQSLTASLGASDRQDLESNTAPQLRDGAAAGSFGKRLSAGGGPPPLLDENSTYSASVDNFDIVT